MGRTPARGHNILDTPRTTCGWGCSPQPYNIEGLSHASTLRKAWGYSVLGTPRTLSGQKTIAKFFLGGVQKRIAKFFGGAGVGVYNMKQARFRLTASLARRGRCKPKKG